MTSRICTRCGENKPLDSFWRETKARYSRRSICIQCAQGNGARRARASVPVIIRETDHPLLAFTAQPVPVICWQIRHSRKRLRA